MRARIELEVNPSEKSALGSLTSEEREAVIDEMLLQVREDLEWLVALESSRHSVAAQPVPAARPPAPPARPVASIVRPPASGVRPPAIPGSVPARRFSWPAARR